MANDCKIWGLIDSIDSPFELPNRLVSYWDINIMNRQQFYDLGSPIGRLTVNRIFKHRPFVTEGDISRLNYSTPKKLELLYPLLCINTIGKIHLLEHINT